MTALLTSHSDARSDDESFGKGSERLCRVYQ
jgi:hypothetical protein